jgi:hypothetical protein
MVNTFPNPTQPPFAKGGRGGIYDFHISWVARSAMGNSFDIDSPSVHHFVRALVFELYAYEKTVPTDMGCPERNSRMLILLLPSNWISLMR